MRRQKWREGESSPYTGKPSARPAGKPGDFLIAKESLRRSLPRHFLRSANKYTERSVCVFKAWRNLSGPMGFSKQNQTLGWEPTASRWSAPGPGKRTRREDHAPSHRPQMSSDRLFLDRVARQHCPSPLHRHAQTTTHPHPARSKPDISTLQGIGHFYFALTLKPQDDKPWATVGHQNEQPHFSRCAWCRDHFRVTHCFDSNSRPNAHYSFQFRRRERLAAQWLPSLRAHTRGRRQLLRDHSSGGSIRWRYSF